MSTEEQHDFDALAEVKMKVLTCINAVDFLKRDKMLFVSSLTQSCDIKKSYNMTVPSKKSIFIKYH